MRDPGDIPTKVVLGGRVPDLTRISREGWRAALVPFEAGDRFVAANDLYLSPEARKEALALIDTLPPPPSALVRAAVRGARSVPFDGPRTRHEASRQLNLRVPLADHDALLAAARILGVKPTQAARMFIAVGVRRLLAEHDVVIDEVRSAAGSVHGSCP